MRLKAIILDARMACRQQFKAARDALQNHGEALDRLGEEAEAALGLFDRPEAWIQPIEYDARMLFKSIDQFQKSEPDSLEAFSESLHAFLTPLKQLIPPPPRARSILDSPFNGLLQEALLNNRRTVDDIEAMYRENGQNLHQIEEYEKTNTRQNKLVNHYVRKLQANDHQGTAQQVKRIKDWNGFFLETTADTPAADFILDCQDYNEELQSQCPLPTA